MKKYAILVAGGNGSRMGLELPKQFLLLKGKPVLMHTIEVFSSIDSIQIIVVLPSNQIGYWKTLCQEYKFNIPVQLVDGGETRFHSVKNALTLVDENTLVAIHDGVRPLISKEIIAVSFSVANEKGNAVTCVALKDSIRQTNHDSNQSVNRSNYFLIQTPQTFKSDLIKSAYNNSKHTNFTDDASVLEEAGNEIFLIDGDYKNIKITTADDMLIAEALTK